MKLKQLVIGIISWSLITSFAQAATEEELLYLAEFYNRQVMILHQQGKYKEAVPVAEEVFGIRYSLLGIKHPNTLDSLNNLAMIYKAVGRLSEALLLYKECYYLSKQVLGPKHPDTLISLNNLAVIYQVVGRLSEALPLYEQCYKLRKQVLGPKHPYTLQSINNLASIYQAVGRLSEALPLFKQVYELRKQVFKPTHPNILESMNNLAGIYQTVGRLSEALPLFEQGYELSKQVLGSKHPDTLNSMNNLAMIYSAVGRLSEALHLSKQSYDFYKQVLGLKHPHTLQSLNNLAFIYQKIGSLSEALLLFEQTYNLRKQVLEPKHPDILISMNNLAEIYNAVGRLSEILPLYEQSYELSKQVLGTEHPNTLTILNNLAEIYHSLGRLSEALLLHEQCYKLRKLVLGAKHPYTLQSMNNLAEIYNAVGRRSEALLLHKQAYELRKQVLEPKHPDILESLNNLAFFYNTVGRLSEALPLHEQSYDLSKQVLGIKHPNTLNSLNNLAYTYANLGKIDKAIKHFEQTIQGVEYLRKHGNLSAENRQAILKPRIPSYFKLSQLYIKKARLEDAFKTAEKTKARTLMESMTIKLAVQQAGLSTAEQQQIQHTQARISFLNEKIAQESELDKRLTLEMQKNQLVKQAAEFHRSLMQKYPKYAQLNEIQIATAKTDASLIPEDALFISYLLNKYNHVIVFTLDNSGKLQAYDLGKIPNLDQTLKTYNELLATECAVKRFHRCGGNYVWQLANGSFIIGKKPAKDQKPRRVKSLKKISRYLAKQLLEPIKQHLQTKKHWIISPDGALALIPFESLILDNKTVIENYSVSYVQSLSILALLKKRELAYKKLEKRGILLAMGAARYESSNSKNCNKPKGYNRNQTMLSRSLAYDPQAYERAFKDYTWCNLPGTEQELTNLEQLFKYQPILILKNKHANEAKLQSLNQKQTLTRYKYLVFSAHGHLDINAPALSSIVLDQLNTTRKADGYITASEWVGYDLKSDLMFLSACQTGRGKNVRGEGIMGLPYAFYVAGNKNTIMSLWNVKDKSTAEFTSKFFARLKQGKTQLEALTATKREFFNSKKYKRALYWAPFVLYGI